MKIIQFEMAVKDYLYANLMALFVSAGSFVFSFRCVAGENKSTFPVIEDCKVSANRTKLSGYLTIIPVGLLLVTVSQRPKRQKLAPGILVSRGSEPQHVKQNRKRFFHVSDPCVLLYSVC